MPLKSHGLLGPMLNWDAAESCRNSEIKAWPWALLARVWIGTTPLESCLPVSTESEYMLWPSNATPRYISDRKMMHIFTRRWVFQNVHSIRNNQQLQQSRHGLAGCSGSRLAVVKVSQGWGLIWRLNWEALPSSSSVSSSQMLAWGPQFLPGCWLRPLLVPCPAGLSIGQLTTWHLASTIMRKQENKTETKIFL